MDDRLGIISISIGDTLLTAMKAIDLGACEIALAVDAHGRLLGTLTDGDIRRALLAGASVDDLIEPFVNKHPLTVSADASRSEVLDLMKARSINQVPVVDGEGRLRSLHLMRELLGTAPRPNTALILAGGLGTRLGPITEQVPKPMLRVAGRPILERLVHHLVGFGVRDIVLAVGHLADVITGYFGDGHSFGCTITYLHEPERLGTGGPLGLLADERGLPDHPVVVMNGDLVTQLSVADLLDHHAARRAVATVAVRNYVATVPYGVVDLDREGQVVALQEKPATAYRINAGVYVIEPAIIERIPRNVEFPITDLLVDCLSRGETVAGWDLEGDWHDVGKPSDLRLARGEA